MPNTCNKTFNKKYSIIPPVSVVEKVNNKNNNSNKNEIEQKTNLNKLLNSLFWVKHNDFLFKLAIKLSISWIKNCFIEIFISFFSFGYNLRAIKGNVFKNVIKSIIYDLFILLSDILFISYDWFI